MSTFNYPNNTDLVFATEYQVIRDFDLTHIENTLESHNMVNKLKYNLNISGANLVVTPDASNEGISQWQEVVIEAIVDDSIAESASIDGLVVILHLALPTATAPSAINDYDYHIYLRPDMNVDTIGHFYVNINEFLARDLQIGTLNSCYFKFQLQTKAGNTWNSYLQASNQTIGLYRTNTDESYNADNFSNAYATLNEIMERLDD